MLAPFLATITTDTLHVDENDGTARLSPKWGVVKLSRRLGDVDATHLGAISSPSVLRLRSSSLSDRRHAPARMAGRNS